MARVQEQTGNLTEDLVSHVVLSDKITQEFLIHAGGIDDLP